MDAIIMKENNVVVSMMLSEKRNKLAVVLKDAREKKGWTQQDLADRISCQRQTILKIELAKYSPGLDILYQLVECLDLPLKIGNEKI